MRLNSALAVIGVAAALGLASHTPAEANCFRGVPVGCGGAWPGPQGVTHFVYYPQYYDRSEEHTLNSSHSDRSRMPSSA